MKTANDHYDHGHARASVEAQLFLAKVNKEEGRWGDIETTDPDIAKSRKERREQGADFVKDQAKEAVEKYRKHASFAKAKVGSHSHNQIYSNHTILFIKAF